MALLNILGILTLTIKNSFKKEIFSRKKPKRLQKFCLVYQGVFGHLQFRVISDDFRMLSTILEDGRIFPKTSVEVRPLPKMSEESSKHLTVFFSETVDIKKLANLTTNTKNYGQTALNPKTHSDPPTRVFGHFTL